jgi:acetylornithine deacetylase
MDVVSLTEDLAAISSHEDESAAGAFVADWLRDHTDAAVHEDTHGNVIARTGSGTASLALVGHHDVVPPDDSQVDTGEYLIHQRDGRLYGRGTADMKGPLAAAMLAFRNVDPTDGELVFASFAGEEQGGVGCRAAIEDGFGVDYAVVVEGSTGYSAAGVTDVAVAHTGRRGSTIVAEGEAAHAGEVAAGENAIYRAADAVEIVRALDVPTTEVLGHDLRGERGRHRNRRGLRVERRPGTLRGDRRRTDRTGRACIARTGRDRRRRLAARRPGRPADGLWRRRLR